MENFEFKPIPEVKKSQEETPQASKYYKNNIDPEHLVALNVRIEKNLMDLMSSFAYSERYTKREIVSQALEEFLANRNIKNNPELLNKKNRRKIN